MWCVWVSSVARSCATRDANNKYNVWKPSIPAGINRPPPSKTISPVTRNTFISLHVTFSPRRLSISIGDLFFTNRLKKALANVRVHLHNGCLSDPDPRDVQLFFWAGHTANGVDRFRCARGTSNMENYHKPVRDHFAGFETSLRMARFVLLPFNYRRNHRMAGGSDSAR